MISFRKAVSTDRIQIWQILQQAIQSRKAAGSNQWQDGYPNPTVIAADIHQAYGHVLVQGKDIIAYAALQINNEPAYEKIEGQWLTNDNYVVIHRVAVAKQYLGQGYAKKIMHYAEDYALQNQIKSIKVDTNYDNIAMLKIFEQLGYVYCGQVYFRGSPRRAYEKVL